MVRVGLAVAVAGLLASGCAADSLSGTPASSAPASSAPASSAPASSSPISSVPAASPSGQPWQPGDPLRVRVIVQLTSPVPPQECGAAGDGSRIGVGSPVGLEDAAGTPIATLSLREVKAGEPYGPQGYTFGGWSDLDVDASGTPITYACFYVAELDDVPASDGYVASVAGSDDLLYDTETLQVNEGWITQMASS